VLSPINWYLSIKYVVTPQASFLIATIILCRKECLSLPTTFIPWKLDKIWFLIFYCKVIAEKKFTTHTNSPSKYIGKIYRWFNKIGTKEVLLALQRITP
jgi:hypothetical protein